MKRQITRFFSTTNKAKPGLNFLFGSNVLPHPEKLALGGEDSFFTDFGSRFFGVADGVGGYSNKGINSGLYSRAILKQVRELKEDTDLHRILVTATRHVNVNEKVKGGCTVTLGKLNENNQLSLLNYGDSAIAIFRPCIRLNTRREQVLYPRIVYRSVEQTHYFNCPYQLNNEETMKKLPADLLNVTVQDGDIVVCATDGLFDNIYDSSIQLEVSKLWFKIRDAHSSTRKYEQILHDFAKSLSQQAQTVGSDPNAKTPFEEHARKESVRDPGGGKLDDVTVVVGLVGDHLGISESSTRDNFELPAPEGQSQ